MSKDRTEVAVTECDGELYVRVRVFDGEHLVGEARLPGGDMSNAEDRLNAEAMARGLVSIVEHGGDLKPMLLDVGGEA